MNNEPPQFEGLDMTQSNSYKGTVPENELPGQTVIQIKAVDPDHDPPNNVVGCNFCVLKKSQNFT
ncbi:hypothetical protein DPMN_169404 [Dreissena polymorpha]|uniref:Uncharacterized protein n=1 Tax=Dreissena polymorpha TaxID=45954 RepID=A0A9D4DUB2_DREPO|nr:hypothetical protein DPMN_169404 [Dreissena polymorpha]